MWLDFIVGLCVACAWWTPAEPRQARDVKTTQGIARGYFAPVPPHFAFLGMPYAVAKTRFKAPDKPPRWDGIFEATHRVKCPQDKTGDENCLVVNVFAPKGAWASPVLVFVHDGHFQNGWGAYKPPVKLITQGLVIVTFNYRLGPLGFLCLKIPESPGNAGLKDQVAALYWVQRNIANFGGDPNDVTVYGIGSGAAAVQILLLSELTNGLLHKAILESGSVLSPTTMTYNPLGLAYDAAKKLGYKKTNEPEKLVKFFRKASLRSLASISEVFLPCLESNSFYIHSLLSEDPKDILRAGKFHKVPVIITYSSTDGLAIIEKYTDSLSDIPENFGMLLPNNLRMEDEEKKMQIAKLVKEFYFDGDEDVPQYYAEYFHDVLFEFPIIKFGVLFGNTVKPVYIMKFVYKKIGNSSAKEISVDHEVSKYVFGDNLLEQDEMVANRLITLLCNFIKLGDPSPITTSTVPVIWKSVAEGSQDPLTVRTASVLQFSKTLTMTTTHLNPRLSFWEHIYENFYRSYSATDKK